MTIDGVTFLKKTWRLAEKNFTASCTDAGITCNQSVEDEHGWDFILDITPPKHQGHLLSSQDTLKQVLVQVKSTTNGKKSCVMKLSNALNMAKVAKACYVVLYCVKNGETKVYLKHIWENEISAVHRKATLHEAKGRIDFHKVSYQLHFDETELCMENVAEAIKQHQSGLSNDYHLLKTKIAKSVGFEHEVGTGKISFAFEKPEDFPRMMLGLERGIACPNFSFTPSRFGISIPHLERKLRNGKISVEPSYFVENIKICIDGHRTIFYEAIATSYAIPNAMEETFGVRFDIAGFNLVFCPNVKMPSPRFTLDRAIERGIMDLTFICGCFSGRKIALELKVGSQWQRFTTFSCSSSHDMASFDKLLTYLQWLEQIERQLNNESVVKFSISEVFDAFDQISEAYILANYDGTKFGFENIPRKIPDTFKRLIRPVFIFTEPQLISMVTISKIDEICETSISTSKFEFIGLRVFGGEQKIEEALTWYETEIAKFNGMPDVLYMRPATC